MPRRTFNEQWKEAMNDLALRLEVELPLDVSQRPQVRSWIRADSRKQFWFLLLLCSFQTIADIYQQQAQLYIHYIRIFKKLEDCYDQISHPQKRTEIKKALEAVMTRILELKDVSLN